jgi:ArsR family transcriptional regulator
MCVSDITETLSMNQTTVSHQLKTMRDMGMVDYNRNGKVLTYYIRKSKVLDVLLSAVEML